MKKIKNVFILIMFSISMGAFSQERSQHGHMDNHDHGQANTHMNQRPFGDLVATFEDKGRDAWQKPDEVIARLGEIRGRTVMDLGSGTGYFSFRLADAGARVICADVDERFLDYIRTKRDKMKISATEMELRKIPFDSSTLASQEADVVLIVDAYHHIQDRESYFNEVRNGLKPGGKLVIVDFQKRELPEGPPVSMKLSEDEVIAELARAGFRHFDIDPDTLPYQYIIEAR